MPAGRTLASASAFDGWPHSGAVVLAHGVLGLRIPRRSRLLWRLTLGYRLADGSWHWSLVKFRDEASGSEWQAGICPRARRYERYER